MRMPGFTAELSLVKRSNEFRNVAQIRSIRVIAEVRPQMRRAVGDIDWGSYLRCKAAGGPELICRFFGGLPPFTIGGLLF